MNYRSIFGFALGPIGIGVISLASLPVMTWVFPAEMIGKLSMLQVAIGFAIVSCCLGLDQAYGREYHETSDQARLFLNVIAPGLVLLLGILGVFFIFDPGLLSVALFGIHSSALSAIVAICLISAYVARFLSLILRMQSRGLTYSISQMFAPLVLLLIVLGYAIFSEQRTFLMLLIAQAMALASGLFMLGALTRPNWLPAFHERLNPLQLRSLLSFGYPLAFSGIAFQGVATLDRVFLRSFSTYDELAVYSVAASIASGVTVVASIFNTIWAPLVYKWLAEGEVVKEKVDKISAAFSAIMAMLLCVVGGSSWLIDYILPSDYSQVKFLIVGCMVSPMLYTFAEVTGIGIAISRRTGFSLIASCAAVGLNIVIGYLLVGRLGATGAVISTALSFYLFFLLRTEFSSRIWMQNNRKNVYGYSFLCLMMSLGYVLFGNEKLWMSVIFWWIVFLIILLVNRDALKELFEFFRKFWSQNK